MSCTFPLPLECLQLIVHHLTAQQALKSTAALLCVNKYVCAATLPILYRDPFNMQPLHTGFGNNRNIVLGLNKLVHILLCSLPPSSSSSDDESIHDDDGLVTELLRAFYFQSQEQGDALVAVDSTETCERLDKATTAPTAPTEQLLPPTLLPYSSYLTRVSFEELNLELGRIQFTLGDFLDRPDFQDFLRRTGCADRYRAEEPLVRYICGSQEEFRLFAQSAEREIRRDLAWAMCCSNAERIQTLHLPISDIGRYLTLVPRLKVLASVIFQIDKNLAAPSYWDHGMSEEEECWARLKEDRVRHLEEMISFVQEHQRRHRNVIQTARCANDRVYEDQCPEDYTIRLLQSLPPLVKPQFLDYRNWDQFVAHLPDTDLSFVREIRTGNAFDKIIKQELFLLRCRSLESIYATSSVEGIFKWAVQERKDYEDAAAVVHNCGAVVAASEQRSLVPLRDYDVVCSWAHSGRQASDVIYAFNKTLENIKVNFCGITATYGPQLFPDFVLGRRIDDDDDSHVDEGDAMSSFSPSSFSSSLLNLPRLRSISISTDFLTLRIHPALLAQSPSLVSVTLDDRLGRDYLADTVVYWEPAELPHLTELKLFGTPAVSFHPETLRSTRNLVRLELHFYAFQNGAPAAPAAPVATAGQDEADDNSSTPDGISGSFATQTLQQPVAWTWDWDLPKLTNLSLVAEFAHEFHFRMLDSTPNLNYLSLDVHGGAGPERNRAIGIEELLRPGFRHSLLPLFLERDQQLCERRRRRQVVSDRVENDDDDDDDAICRLQRQEEKEDDELWRQEFEFLQLPKLQTLYLIGPWDVDHPRVLNAFFSKVAPRITSLWVEPISNGNCYCQEGFTIPELIRSTTENLHELNLCVVKIPFKLELVAETGLVVDPSCDGELAGAGWWRVFVMAERPAGRKLDSPARYRFRTGAGTML